MAKKKIDIQKIRLEKNLSRKEVADRLGVSIRTVESWEYGTRDPSKQIIMLIDNGALG